MYVYAQILDQLADKKSGVAGQMSLFDIAPEETRAQMQVQLPDVGEFDRTQLLENEKEVLGIYLSGHPLEDDAALLKKNTTVDTVAFYLDEDTGETGVEDGRTVTVGGIIAERKTKYTRNEKIMAFLQLEDLTGTVEVIVFPKTYDLYSDCLFEDAKVLIEGRVSLEEDRDAKLIAQKITPFDRIPKKIWIRFADKTAWQEQETSLYAFANENPGDDLLTVMLNDTKQYKTLGKQHGIRANEDVLDMLRARFGEENIKIS